MRGLIWAQQVDGEELAVGRVDLDVPRNQRENQNSRQEDEEQSEPTGGEENKQEEHLHEDKFSLNIFFTLIVIFVCLNTHTTWSAIHMGFHFLCELSVCC